MTTAGSGYLSYYAFTNDGGYLGVGQIAAPANTWCDKFDIEKFGQDGRNDAKTFLGSVDVYPNPCFDGNTTLSFDLQTDENVQIRVFTLDGRHIYYDEIFCPANSHTEVPIVLDQGTTAAGTYILEVRTSGEHRRQLLVVGRSKLD